MRDLNDLVDASAAGGTLNEAWAINNAGHEEREHPPVWRMSHAVPDME